MAESGSDKESSCDRGGSARTQVVSQLSSLSPKRGERGIGGEGRTSRKSLCVSRKAWRMASPARCPSPRNTSRFECSALDANLAWSDTGAIIHEQGHQRMDGGEAVSFPSPVCARLLPA